MTCSAGLGVFPLECGRIEPGTVGIEPPPALRRVTGETVPLGVAGNAALEALPRGLAVIEDEGLLRIMKADASEPAWCDQSRVHMAVGAELSLVVAFIARAFPTVRGGGMCREEPGRMVARRRICRAGTMALEARWPSVAGHAALRPR